jgi:hypothetical protein
MIHEEYRTRDGKTYANAGEELLKTKKLETAKLEE